ncbi:MAG: YdcF family protein [Pseudomonadota bacterium]
MVLSPGEIAFAILQPSNALAMLAVLGCVIVVVWRRAGTTLLAFSAASYLALGLLPIGAGGLRYLEKRFEIPHGYALDPPDGIILLGGHHTRSRSILNRQIALNHAGERLTTTAALAARFPEAQVIVSDGGLPFPAANLSGILLRDFGVAPRRIILEDASLSTWDNAVFTREIVTPRPDGRYILVTSGWHMPRSVGAFRAAGWPEPIPWPVDHINDGRPIWRAFNGSASEGLRLADLAAREWLALLVYRLRGQTPSLVPGP